MIELAALFILLPVAFASGWYLARYRGSHKSRQRAEQLSSNYFRGLNYLLNEQPDKAIEVFLKLAEVNQDTVETHLALGSLFRRRGEMDKAVRFHKHIITRNGLTEEQRAQALLELGLDYMQAGLLDRAERLFSELLDHDYHQDVPARQLLDIYQQEKDWEKAIEQARRLKQADSTERDRLIAQFYCELAREALEGGDQEAVMKALRQARRHDPSSPRPRLLHAELERQQGRWEDAAACYREACDLDPDCLVFGLQPLVEAHDKAGMAEYTEHWLAELVERQPMTTAIVALARIKAETDPRAAVEFLLEHQSERPTVRGLEYLMELVYRQGVSLDELGPEMIENLMRRLLDRQPRFRCQQCGFSGSSWHWLCPSCRQWNTTRAITGVLGE